MVLAEIGAGTLLRALVLALVLVTPYFLVTRRKVRAARAAVDAVAGDPTDDDGPPPDPTALETVVATIGTTAGSLADGDTARITVPEGATVDDRPVPAPVRDAVLADALARSGLVEVSRRDDAGHLVLEVRRA